MTGAVLSTTEGPQGPIERADRCSQTRNPGSDVLSHVSIAGRTGGIVSIR